MLGLLQSVGARFRDRTVNATPRNEEPHGMLLHLQPLSLGQSCAMELLMTF